MAADCFAALGEFLTAREAVGIAAQLSAGQHSAAALREVSPARREEAKKRLAAAGIGHEAVDRSLAVLGAISGAKIPSDRITPVWTMPGNEATAGRLTGEFHRLVDAARQSVTCATYNFEPTSQMWTALQEASERPGVSVTVYLDESVSDAEKIKAQLGRAAVYRSAALLGGEPVVSHAKFVVIDHEIVLVTSANFSYSAENRNVEFGLLVHDSGLAASVEDMMASKHGTLYEAV